jgi:N-methylhydantoinase B
MGRAADAEMNEFQFPILYLWRREEIDSGGPGRFRGGLGGASCYVIHDSSIRQMHIVVSSTGKAIPQATGISGGYPCNTTYDVAVRGSSFRQSLAKGRWPRELSDLGGTIEMMQPEGGIDLGWDDVYYANWQGGGAYGDPLLRDPERVVYDVAEHKVSALAARSVYGVVLKSDGGFDPASTAELRRQLFMQRVAKGGREPLPRKPPNPEWTRIDDNLMIDGEGRWCCAHCGSQLAARGDNYLDGALKHEGSPSEAGPQIRGDAREFVDAPIVFRQYCCPGCYVALLTEIVPAAEPQLRLKRLAPHSAAARV